MAVAENSIQVKWGASNTVSVAAGGSQVSDDFTFSGSAFEATIMLKGDNAGTPADGDTVDFYLQYADDPDQAGGNDYANQGDYIGTIDTFADDPAIKVLGLVPRGVARIRAESSAGANAVVVSARIIEKTA